MIVRPLGASTIRTHTHTWISIFVPDYHHDCEPREHFSLSLIHSARRLTHLSRVHETCRTVSLTPLALSCRLSPTFGANCGGMFAPVMRADKGLYAPSVTNRSRWKLCVWIICSPRLKIRSLYILFLYFVLRFLCVNRFLVHSGHMFAQSGEF